MPKTNEQIFEWSKPPSRENDLSAKTYNSIKTKLEGKFWSNVDIFLQGSYANSTNIKQDSDIDIVIVYKNSFFFNIEALTSDEKINFHKSTQDATYTFMDFKREVEVFLQSIYWLSVERKNKCIQISWNSHRVDADVIPCFNHYRYNKLDSISAKWIQFITDDKTSIISFPKQHLENGKNKNQQTKENYKWFVRILKNCKKDLIKNKVIDEKLISSFLIECLVWNLNNSMFIQNKTYKECLNDITIKLYEDMWNKEVYKNYAEVSDLFYLLRWWRVNTTPNEIKTYLDAVYNLINK